MRSMQSALSHAIMLLLVVSAMPATGAAQGAAIGPFDARAGKFGMVIKSDAARATDTLAVSSDRAWLALRQVYDELGIPLTVADTQSHGIGALRVEQLTALTNVQSIGEKRSVIDTRVGGTASPNGTNSSVTCASSGVLEGEGDDDGTEGAGTVSGAPQAIRRYIFRPVLFPERNAHHDRILHRLNVRAEGHQFGGRDYPRVSSGATDVDSQLGRPFRSDEGWNTCLREVEIGAARREGRNRLAAAFVYLMSPRGDGTRAGASFERAGPVCVGPFTFVSGS